MVDDSGKTWQRSEQSVKQHAATLSRTIELETARAHFRTSDDGIARARAEFDELCVGVEKSVAELKLNSTLPLQCSRLSDETFVLTGPHCCATISFGTSHFARDAAEPRSVTVIAWRGEAPPQERGVELAKVMLLPDLMLVGSQNVAWYCRFGTKDDFWATRKVCELLLHWFMDQVEKRLNELAAEYRARVDLE